MGKVINIVDVVANRDLDEKYKTLLEREKRIESEIACKCQKEIDELNEIEAEKERIERNRLLIKALRAEANQIKAERIKKEKVKK
jgi:hypothetical protein